MALTPLEIAGKINEAAPSEKISTAERYIEEYDEIDKDEVAAWLMEMAFLDQGDVEL